MRNLLILIVLLITFSCKTQPTPIKTNVNTNSPTKTTNSTAKYGYEIVNTYKHDEEAFTQGLVFFEGFLFESTGQYEESSLRKVELTTGKVLQKYKVPDEYFAEGMTILNNKIYQISWREQTAFVYDMDFKLLKELKYSGEGWGLTNDGSNLIMSDGTHLIRIINPENFETIGTVSVFHNGQPLMNINELEMVKGELWANVWHSESIGLPNHIARIDPKNGNILGWIDLQGISLEDVKRNSENTLNGIAYDQAGDRIFVTGKNWRKLFEIKLVPKS